MVKSKVSRNKNNANVSNKEDRIKFHYWKSAEYSLMVYLLTSTLILMTIHSMQFKEILKSSLILGGILITFSTQLFNNYLMTRFELIIEEYDDNFKKAYILRLKYILSSFSTLLILLYLTYILLTFFKSYLNLFIFPYIILCLIFIYLILSSIGNLLKK